MQIKKHYVCEISHTQNVDISVNICTVVIDILKLWNILMMN